MEMERNEEIKFKQLADEWLEFKKPQIKESTYLNYKFIVNGKLKECFGEKSLRELTEYNFNRFVQNCLQSLANKTVRNLIIILKEMLRYAEVKYDMNFKLSLIASPKIRKKEVEIFKDKERRKIIRKCMRSDNLYHLGILISIYTGLRIGEVCALKWSNIDFENKLISVTSTIQRVYLGKGETKVICTEPKTQNAIRKIPIPKSLFEKLKEESKKYNDEAYILSGKTNKWIEPLCFRYKYRKFLKENRIRYKKYHCLRHTFATSCIGVGMDVKSLGEILGHSNASITLNIYVHSSYTTKKKFMDRL